MRRLKAKLQTQPILRLSRKGTNERKLVYFIVVPKPLRYPLGKSRIVYIGTTGQGLDRIAKSTAYRARYVLRIRGVKSFDVFIATCTRRPRVKTWEQFERALLVLFRQVYGRPPRCNELGKRTREGQLFNLFNRTRLKSILKEFE